MTLDGAFPDTGSPYLSTLTAAGSPEGGTYSWTTDFPEMIAFDSGAGSATASVRVLRSGKARITVTYSTQCSSQDSLTFVLTDDVTVVAWVNGSAIQIPSGASEGLIDYLTDQFKCAATVGSWMAAAEADRPGLAVFAVNTDIDRRYANAFLNSRSGNPKPPGFMTDPVGFRANKNLYRGFNRFKAYYEIGEFGIHQPSVKYLQQIADPGNTPEPCTDQRLVLATSVRLEVE